MGPHRRPRALYLEEELGRRAWKKSLEVLFLQKVFGLVRFALVAALALSAVLPSSLDAQAPQYHPPVVASTDTLAGTDYNNRYELYAGLAYSHFNAGPSLLQGSNLGGIDLQGARFFSPRFAVAADVRGYFGTSGVVPNIYNIRGPFVSESMFMAGPEYRWVANERASVTLHALFGGAYGDFTSGLGKTQPGHVRQRHRRRGRPEPLAPPGLPHRAGSHADRLRLGRHP